MTVDLFIEVVHLLYLDNQRLTLPVKLPPYQCTVKPSKSGHLIVDIHTILRSPDG